MTNDEDTNTACLVCGISHRYQWPNGSDASEHDGDYVACVNSLLWESGRLRTALHNITVLAAIGEDGREQ